MPPLARLLALALAFCPIANAAETPADPAPSSSSATADSVPLFPGTGAHTRPVTGASPLAQRYFDQGVALITNFNHDEGLRSMQHATSLSPEAPLLWWGVALACSPHINATGVSAERAALAWQALDRADAVAAAGTPAERALIRAARTHFAADPKAPRRPLDEAYASAMREVWREFPRDADIGAWFAEALMVLRPWDLWHPDGSPKPGTDEVVGVLDAVLRLTPRHPLGNHLAVHAHEASAYPEKADVAADRLRVIAPGLGHLVHMASHIDVRRGRWDEAILVNQRAIEIDLAYVAAAGRKQGNYLGYMAHDYHMLCFAAMMSGRGALAAKIMDDLFVRQPPEWQRDSAAADGFHAMRFDVMKRFGKWDEILAAPEPAEKLGHARAWRFLARGIARAARGDPVGARAEQADFVAARAKLPPKAEYRKNPLKDVMDIAAGLLEGEILLAEGKPEPAFAALRGAIAREDKLRYAEPPAWAQPVRHALGAALMQRGRFAEAELVYREDLARYPDNGWSLYGLARSLRLQKKDPADADRLEARFREVWAHADVELTSSCLCLPGQ